MAYPFGVALDLDGGMLVAETLKVNTTLKSYTINLSECSNVQNEGVTAMAMALIVNTTLQSYAIDLWYCGNVQI